jgi:hypothetical protein
MDAFKTLETDRSLQFNRGRQRKEEGDKGEIEKKRKETHTPTIIVIKTIYWGSGR